MQRGGPQMHALDRPMPVGDAVVQTLLFLRRRWLSILLCGLIGLVGSVLLVSRLPPLYKSTALLTIERPRSSPMQAEPASLPQDQASYIEGQLFVFTTAPILDAVRDAAGVAADPEFLPDAPGPADRLMARVMGEPAPLTADQVDAAARRKLASGLTVRREGDTNVVSVAMEAGSAEKAARIANAFLDAYIADSEAQQRDKAARVADWMQDRALQIRQQLAEAEAAVATYRSENNLIEGQSGATLSSQQLFDLNAELIRVRTERAARSAAFERATALAQGDGDLQTLPEVQSSEIVRALRTEMFALERRIGEMEQQGVATNRRLEPLREQLADLNGQIAAEVDRIVAAIGNDLEVLGAREALLADAVAAAGGRTGDDSQASVTLQELERVAASYRELYQPYLANIEMARGGGAMLVSGTDVISRAVPPVEPSSPPKKVICVVLTLLGLGAGALLALLREWLQQGFVTARQVEATLGLGVLNALPELRRSAVPMDIVRQDPESAYAEAVQVVRNALSMRPGRAASRVILVTSAGQGDGKTSLSSALAASAVNARQRVLVIDADFRHAGMSRLVGAVGETGLSDILSTSELDFDTGADGPPDGVDVIPIGRHEREASRALNGSALARVLAQARRSYDLIIIDGPPVANLADASILSEVSDAVVFVVRWQATTRQSASDALRRLPPEKLAGVVLNAIDPDAVAHYGERHLGYGADAADRTAA